MKFSLTRTNSGLKLDRNVTAPPHGDRCYRGQPVRQAHRAKDSGGQALGKGVTNVRRGDDGWRAVSSDISTTHSPVYRI